MARHGGPVHIHKQVPVTRLPGQRSAQEGLGRAACGPTLQNKATSLRHVSPATYGRRACTVTPSSRNAAPAVSPRGTRSSGRLQDGGAAWLQRVKLACLLRCLVAVCGAASLLRTRRCARTLHKCSKRQLAQLLRHAAAAKCARYFVTVRPQQTGRFPKACLRHG